MRPEDFLTADQQKIVVDAVRIAEKGTSGEIRIHIDDQCSIDPVKKAQDVFQKLGMHRTALRNGVLIYLACNTKVFSIIGDKGMLSFSVYTYEPIVLHTERGVETLLPQNPPYVQLPIIQAVVEHLQGKSICTCDGLSATTTNWVMDRILNKL